MIFKELLQKPEPLLIASLPENSTAFALAAQEAGADAVKLHINVKHRATGMNHLPWREARSVIREIIRAVSIPIGIVPGAEIMASKEETEEMAQEGIAFFDAYVEYFPLWALDIPVSFMAALNYSTPVEITPFLEETGADCIELSVIPPEKYGRELTFGDYALYKTYSSRSHLPVFVPTQKRMTPDDCRRLILGGVKGIIIGAIVTGTDLDHYKENILSFSKAVKGSRL